MDSFLARQFILFRFFPQYFCFHSFNINYTINFFFIYNMNLFFIGDILNDIHAIISAKNAITNVYSIHSKQ